MNTEEHDCPGCGDTIVVNYPGDPSEYEVTFNCLCGETFEARLR